MKFLLLLVFIIIFYTSIHYSFYLYDYYVEEHCLYDLGINKLRYPGSIGQHNLYINTDMPYFDEIDE